MYFQFSTFTGVAVAVGLLTGVQANAQSIGSLGLFGEGYLALDQSKYYSTDDDFETLDGDGYSLGGVIGLNYNGFVAYIDANKFDRDLADETDDFDQEAPFGARAYGLHAGYDFALPQGNLYAGAFYGKNEFQGDDAASPNGYVDGDLYGIEAEYSFSNYSVFAQYGRADMVGDVGDTAFDGDFMRVGFNANIDRLDFVMDYESGRSDDIFEDSGDWGEYRTFGVELDYQVTDRVSAYVAYTDMDFDANDEDFGTDQFVSLGVRVAFGEKGRRTNLTTTYMPGLAAAWAENLD